MKKHNEQISSILFDVIGFVISIGPLEEYHLGSEVKSEMRLTLSDERENTVQMVLYDECALNFCVNDFTSMQKPIVLVAQLARVSFDDNGRPEVCTSFHGTKIHLNGKFVKVQNFLASAENLPSPTISSLSQSVDSQRSNSTVESIIRNTPRVKVADIPNQELERYFAVLGEFKKLETRHGWIYEGCSRCGTKPKVETGSTSCSSNFCKGKPCSIQSKLRLNYLIGDDSGTVSVVLFDKHTTELMKKTAAELKAHIPEDALKYEFPSEVDSLIGKKMILKLKLNKYNKDHSNSSVSVASYAECADLMNDCNAADLQVAEPSRLVIDEEEDFIFMRNVNVEDKKRVDTDECVVLSETFPTAVLDGVPPGDVIPAVSLKGKMKVFSKKPYAQGSKSVALGDEPPTKSAAKPLKSIKQEKN